MTTKINVNCKQTLAGHRQAVYCMVFFDGSLFSAGADGLVARWNYPENNDAVLFAEVGEPVYSLSNYNGYLVAGGKSGNLYILQSNVAAKLLTAHRNGIFAIRQIGENVYTGGGDGRLMQWSQDWKLINDVQLSQKPIRSLISDDNHCFAGGSDGSIYSFNPNLSVITSWIAHERAVFALEIYNSNCLMSGSLDARLKVWDFQGQLQLTANAHLLHIHSIALNQSKSLLLTGSMDKSIKIWNPITLELLKVLDKSKGAAHSSSVNCIVWLDNATFATCSDDRSIMVWEVEY